jgi:hypothetical protein
LLHLPNDNPYYLWYRFGDSIEYFPDTNIFKEKSVNGRRAYVKYIDAIFKRNPLSEQITDILFSLTGGNIDTLSQLAKMAAKIGMTRNPNGYMTVIKYINENSKRYLADFMNMVYGVDGSTKLKDLCNAKNAVQMINEQLNNFAVPYFSLNQGVPEAKHESILKTLIATERHDNKSGTIVQTTAHIQSAEYVKKYNFVNHWHIVYATNNAKESATLCSMCLGSQVNQFALHDAKNYSHIELTDSDIDWFKTVFTIWGMKLLTSGAPQKKQAEDTTDTLQRFVDACCDLEEGAEVFYEDLYNAYKKFMRGVYRLDPLDDKRFKVGVKKIYKLEDWRTKKARIGIKGIRVNEVKLQAALDAAEMASVVADADRQELYEYLKEMTAEIHKAMP